LKLSRDQLHHFSGKGRVMHPGVFSSEDVLRRMEYEEQRNILEGWHVFGYHGPHPLVNDMDDHAEAST